MAKLKFKLTITSVVITVFGVAGYIGGLIIPNPHMVAFSTEIAGAGAVALLVSLIR